MAEAIIALVAALVAAIAKGAEASAKVYQGIIGANLLNAENAAKTQHDNYNLAMTLEATKQKMILYVVIGFVLVVILIIALKKLSK